MLPHLYKVKIKDNCVPFVGYSVHKQQLESRVVSRIKYILVHILRYIHREKTHQRIFTLNWSNM